MELKKSRYMTPLPEFLQRQKKLEEMISDVDAFLFFVPRSIFYLCGCALSSTERPVVFIHIPGKENVLFVPRMEKEHAEYTVDGCLVECYTEYPDYVHPMILLANLLEKLEISQAFVATDADGYSSAWGYRGPKLSEVCPGMKLKLIPQAVPTLRMIKSDFEIDLMRESAKWSNFEHTLLKEYTKPGLREVDICFKATAETIDSMLKAFGPTYRMSGMDKDGARAVFRGQVGKNAAFPHAVNINAQIRKGDGLVTGVNTYIQGYFTEMERTLFVGEPTSEQKKFYDFALELQAAALLELRPGNECAKVDETVRKYYRDYQLEPYWRHHSGHAIGQEGHEIPFLDVGDHTVLHPGMCVTLEPGVYVEGLGGFRVSDTFLITEDGAEQLTTYGKNLDDIICE